MNKFYILLLGTFCFFLCSGFFLIKEGERGVFLRFGKIIQNKDTGILVYKPGLHYKLPLIESVKKINFKIQTTENRSHIFIPEIKQDFIMDYYIKWKINNFNVYALANKGNYTYIIETLLKSKFNSLLYSKIKNLRNNIYIMNKIYLSNKNLHKKFNFYPFIFKNSFLQSFFINKKNNLEKSDYVKNNYISFKELINSSNKMNLGIKVLDISIKKIILPHKTLKKIYYCMNLENKLIANNTILQGRIIAKKIKLKADDQVIKILSDAKRKELIIRGEGEIISLRLLSSFFIKEPDFYRFFRTIQIYKKILYIRNNLILMNIDDCFF